jgi:hypothetical protein
MTVEITVRIIIDGTAGGPHECRAGNKDQHDPPERITVTRDPERPEAGPEQQQDTDRAIKPDQFRI